jgi:hypothetical protein
VPFRDFTPEYPPLAMLLLYLPCLITKSPEHYEWTFRGCLCVVDVSLWFSLLFVHGHRKMQNLLYIACTTAMGPLLYDRLDLLLGGLLLLASHAVAVGRLRSASIATGFAIAYKIIPIVWMPILVAWAWRRRGILESVIAAILMLVPLIISFATVASLGGNHLDGLFKYHSERGIQLESMPASAEMLMMAAGVPGVVDYGFGSVNLHTRFENDIVLICLFLLLNLIATAVLWTAARRRLPAAVVACLTALLLATLLLDKVFSPQYLLFAIPLLVTLPPLGSRWKGTLRWALIASIYLESGLIFPWYYGALMSLNGWCELAIGLRNLQMLALAVWVFHSGINLRAGTIGPAAIC